MRNIFLLGACLSLTVSGASLASDGPSKPAPPVRPGQTTWLEPTPGEVFAPSDEQKAAAQQSGRPLPTPELLRPSLDPALPHYTPTPGLTVRATFRAGSSDILPTLVTAWVKAFRAYHPGFQLEIDRPMAGSLGALELIKGNLDLVFVSRELKPTDISGFRDKFGYDPFSVPVSGGSWRHFGFLDALGIMVHPSNPAKQLTFAQLDAAFSSTRHRGGKEVKTWGDLGLGGKWAKRPVHLYGIAPWNGFEEFVRQRVLSTKGKRGEWSKHVTFDPTFFNVARRVANDPNALGYTGLSAIDSEVKIVPVKVSDTAPALSPTYENVASAAYPLSRVIYLNTNPRSPAAANPAMSELIKFILSAEGQAVVQQHGIYLPLRGSQVQESRDLALSLTGH